MVRGFLILVTMCLFLNTTFSQEKGRTCSNPIPINLKDSLVSIETKFTPYTWYIFETDTSEHNFVITSEQGGAYQVYEMEEKTCINGEIADKVPLSKAEVSKESANSGTSGLTQEEIDGVCTCRFCEEGGRKVHLEGRKKYLISVSGEQAQFRLNTKGVKESNVWVQKNWYELPMEKGQKLVLENILFYGGETNLLPNSQTDLEHLTRVMEKNPNMKIEIQGHVNAPGQRNTKENQDLSAGRAEAIYNYLIMKGVHAERMSFVGYGNTQMVYPKPENEWQQKKNRRVEVLIKDI